MEHRRRTSRQPRALAGFFSALTLSFGWNWKQLRPDLHNLILAVFTIDLVLLIFNMLPIYPLDGGQILRSVLWYLVGRAHSLIVATVIGFVDVAALAVYAIRSGSTWLFILSVFVVLNCWGGFKHSIFLLRLGKLPRRPGFACPWCKAAPLEGRYWVCSRCRLGFDAFTSDGFCPSCNDPDFQAQCFDCGRPHKISEWALPPSLAQHA